MSSAQRHLRFTYYLSSIIGRAVCGYLFSTEMLGKIGGFRGASSGSRRVRTKILRKLGRVKIQASCVCSVARSSSLSLSSVLTSTILLSHLVVFSVAQAGQEQGPSHSVLGEHPDFFASFEASLVA